MSLNLIHYCLSSDTEVLRQSPSTATCRYSAQLIYNSFKELLESNPMALIRHRLALFFRNLALHSHFAGFHLAFDEAKPM